MATKKQDENPRYGATGLEGDVTTAATAKDTDTFHKAVVQEGAPAVAADPANEPVVVKSDIVEDFQYPRTTRPARRLTAAAGTLTTRRLAEESGIKSSQVTAWSPEGDEPDNARATRSQPISTTEAESGSSSTSGSSSSGTSSGSGSKETKK